MNKKRKKSGGFEYYISDKMLKEYRNWSIERRLEWLYYGNLLRKYLPKEIIEIQEKFRRGEI